MVVFLVRSLEYRQLSTASDAQRYDHGRVDHFRTVFPDSFM